MTTNYRFLWQLWKIILIFSPVCAWHPYGYVQHFAILRQNGKIFIVQVLLKQSKWKIRDNIHIVSIWVSNFKKIRFTMVFFPLSFSLISFVKNTLFDQSYKIEFVSTLRFEWRLHSMRYCFTCTLKYRAKIIQSSFVITNWGKKVVHTRQSFHFHAVLKHGSNHFFFYLSKLKPSNGKHFLWGSQKIILRRPNQNYSMCVIITSHFTQISE